METKLRLENDQIKGGRKDALCDAYRQLAEMLASDATVSHLVANVPLGKIPRINRKTYPTYPWRLGTLDYAALRDIESETSEQLMARALTPLEKLAMAFIWKQGDLGKVGHVVAGVGDAHLDRTPTHNNAAILRQFGRHIALPAKHHIADQHTVRAYLYLTGMGLDDNRLASPSGEDVGSYLLWLKTLRYESDEGSGEREKEMRELDDVLFALGRETKRYMPKPTEKNNARNAPQ